MSVFSIFPHQNDSCRVTTLDGLVKVYFSRFLIFLSTFPRLQTSMANKKAVSYFWKIIERLNFDVQHFSRKVLACRQMMTGISEEAILRQSSCFVSCSIHQFLWGRCIKQVYLEIGEAPSTRGRHLGFFYYFFCFSQLQVFSLFILPRETCCRANRVGS